MGVRVNVVEAYPNSHFTQLLAELLHVGLHRHAVPESCSVFYIYTVRTGILRDNQ